MTDYVRATFLGGPWHERQDIGVIPGTRVIRVAGRSGGYEVVGVTSRDEQPKPRIIEVNYWWAAAHMDTAGQEPDA